MDFLYVNNINLPPFCTVSEMTLIGPIFAVDEGEGCMPLFNGLIRGEAINSGLRNSVLRN